MHDNTRGSGVGDHHRSLLFWVLLPALAFAAIAIFYPCAQQNWPIAINVDDRTSLSVLLRFHQGSANPKFFMYPTLYFYLTYLLTAGFGLPRLLLAGHLVNLAILGVTAWLGALFCLRQFRSVLAAVVAALAILMSPTLARSGAYLCTDILLSAMTILSLDLLMVYFRSRTARNWAYAMVAIGCAVASKYTAAVLLLVYVLGEFLHLYRDRPQTETVPPLEPSPFFGRATVYTGLGVLVGLELLAGALFPTHAILRFVALHRTNLDTRSTQEYLAFLGHLRRLLIAGAVGTALLFVAAARSLTVYRCVSLRRLCYGALIVTGVFLFTTPYSVLDPAKFFYDLGALARVNVVVIGGHQQWLAYGRWLFEENKILVLLGIAGLGLLVYRLTWIAFTPISFTVLHVIAICTAHRGFARYLDPLLPVIYCAAGFTCYEVWRRIRHKTGERSLLGFAWRSAAVLGATALLFFMIRRTVGVDRSAAERTAYYTAYDEVQKIAQRSSNPGSKAGAMYSRWPEVLYAGFAPSTELSLAGFRVREVSWASLAGHSIGQELNCDEVLILNERSAATNKVDAALDKSLEMLSNDPKGEGQIVVRRRGCSKGPEGEFRARSAVAPS